MINIGEAFSDSQDSTCLFVASNGGHLEQMYRLVSGSSESIGDGAIWSTFDSDQSRTLLGDKPVVFIDDIPQRDWVGAIKAVPHFYRLIRAHGITHVVSTGAAVAVPAFIAARMRRAQTLYVESVSRFSGPSLTGKIVSKLRLASKTWCQHRRWSDRRWEFHGSVLDHYVAAEKQIHDVGVDDVPSVFVTFGTLKKYPFQRAVESLKNVSSNPRSVWQIGVTECPRGLTGSAQKFLTTDQFDKAIRDSQVVITHAGVGTILKLLERGVFPVVLIRRKKYGEHIDDHQAQIAEALETRGLAIVREADEVTEQDIQVAASMKVMPA